MSNEVNETKFSSREKTSIKKDDGQFTSSPGVKSKSPKISKDEASMNGTFSLNDIIHFNQNSETLLMSDSKIQCHSSASLVQKFESEVFPLESEYFFKNVEDFHNSSPPKAINPVKSMKFEPVNEDLWIYKSPNDRFLPGIMLQNKIFQEKCIENNTEETNQKSKSLKSRKSSNLVQKMGRTYLITAANRLRMKQPFKILMDIWDILVPRSFKEDLDRYANNKLSEFIDTNWDSEMVRKLWSEFTNTVNHLPMKMDFLFDENPPKEKLVKAILENIDFLRKNPLIKVGELYQEIVDEIWQQGYKTKDLCPPLYGDVLPALKVWNYEPLFVKIYTLATGTAPYQKTFLGATEFGKPEFSYLLKDYFNSQNRYKRSLYAQVASALNEWNPQNLFYMTSSLNRAKEAAKARLTPILVLRDGFVKYTKERVDEENLISVNKLTDLEFFVFGLNKTECC